VQVQGLRGVPYRDQLEPAPILHTQQNDIAFERETDRVYQGGSGQYCIVDGARRIMIKAEACPTAIVWNPWAEKTARLADMAADGWRGMLCVECGAAGSDRIALAAGERRRFRLCVT